MTKYKKIIIWWKKFWKIIVPEWPSRVINLFQHYLLVLWFFGQHEAPCRFTLWSAAKFNWQQSFGHHHLMDPLEQICLKKNRRKVKYKRRIFHFSYLKFIYVVLAKAIVYRVIYYTHFKRNINLLIFFLYIKSVVPLHLLMFVRLAVEIRF